jgi:hypothetical protein
MDIYHLFRFDNIDAIQIISLVVRFIFNIGIATLIILFVYKKNNQNREFSFTLFSFNLIIFALCTILNNVELSIGSGFGLFAVFTMMRYRSEQLQIKDMTYLLIMVGLGFVNSTFEGSIGPIEILFLNVAIFVSLYTLEKLIFDHDLVKQKIKYNRLDLLKVGNKPLLRRDLEEKIGAKVVDVIIESVNYIDGSANIFVKYNREKEDYAQPWILNGKSNSVKENKGDVELAIKKL